MAAKYTAVLDESAHNPLDYDDDTVEIVLNDDEEDDGLKSPVPVQKEDSCIHFGYIFTLWSTLTFGWIKPLLQLGNSRPLESSDLFNLDISDSAKGIYSKFRVVWKEQYRLKSEKASLFITYLTSFGKPFLAAGVLKLIHDSCLFVGPNILTLIIEYLNDPSKSPLVGYIYCLILFLSQLAMSICLRQYFFWCFRVGMRLRSCVITSVFQKSLKLSSSTLEGRSTGQITNLMSLDSTRLQDLTPYLHAIWYSFFQISVALYFLWGQVGPSCLGGVGVILACIPITGKISIYLKRIQTELSKIRDERVKITSEVLSGVKVIKLQAWEEEFEKRLKGVRDQELQLYRRYVFMQSFSSAFSSAIPLFVAVATFSVYVAYGGELDVATALTSLALFEILRFPLFMLPTVLNNLVDASVAIERIRSFLVEIEKQPVLSLSLQKPGILLEKITAVWVSGKRISRENAMILQQKENNKRNGIKNHILSTIKALLIKLKFYSTESITETTNKENIEKQLTEEEYELVLCRAQLAEALSWVGVLEKQLQQSRDRSYLSLPLPHTSSSSLLQEFTDEIETETETEIGLSGTGGVSINGTHSSVSSVSITQAEEEASSKSPGNKAADRVIALSRVSARARSGTLLAIVGQVGCGKSSIFSCLLGDMRVINGKVGIRGSVAYVSQRPFIQNSTVRDNIIFGRVYNEERYNWVLYVCALLPDMKVLPAGDETEIGERGINLSGGQKARVALARAVYSDAEVILLDDPLSAVDAHVGQHLFEYCILTLQSQGKCIIMSTNALHFLKAVSYILVLKEGRLMQTGSYDELIQYNGLFSEMIATFEDGRNSSASQRIGSSESGKFSPSTSSVSLKSNVPTGSVKDPADAPNRSTAATGGTPAGSLMSQEDRVSGSVGREVYMLWAVAAGGGATAVLMVLLFAGSEGLAVLAAWWLAYWSQYRDTASPWYFLGIYAVLNLTVCLSLFLRELYCRLRCWQAGKCLFEEMLHTVLLSPMSFFDTTPLGRITNRMTKDIYTVDESLPQTIRWYIASMLKVASALLYSCIVTPMFILGLFPIIAFYFSAQRFYVKTSRELSRLDSSSRSPIYALFSETLEGMATIRAFRTEDMFIQRINSLLDNNQKAYFLSFAANCWLAVRLEMAGAVIVTLVALFAVMGRDDSPPSPEADARRQAFSGVAGLALSFALSITQSLNWSVRMAADLESQMVAVERINTYAGLTQEAEHSKEGDPSVNWPSAGVVCFEEVCLCYRAGLPRVLDGVTFTTQPKEKIGIVGRTGAGKSSLVVALLRLVELDDGRITIDGLSTADLGLKTLRSAIAVIPQDPILFSGTLRSNVDPFDNYTDAAVWDSLRRVQLGESFTTLEASIGEGASNLSVGQRQLVCIARALLRKSKVIVMDEATAAVDVETDALIQRAIREEFSESTCLTVAHRLNTIMDSDRVLVMDKGAVAEFGTPAELLSDSNSQFSSLVANWERAGNSDI